MFTRLLLIAFCLLVSITWLSSTGSLRLNPSISNGISVEKIHTEPPLKKIRTKAADARVFARQKGYNDNICFLVDMSLPSGQERFFIYNFKTDTLVNAGLVTHGRCNESWLEGRKYGNTVGCGCTSLGKYKIGHSYNGRFGLAYKLFGLEKTNSNAYKRYVVLHAHDCVPETAVREEICQSDGCPTVAPGFLQQLKPMIDRSAKPVLFWIYE